MKDKVKPAEEGASLLPSLGIMGRLRAYFFAGILVTAPISITFFIAWKFVSFVDGEISPLIPPSWGHCPDSAC